MSDRERPIEWETPAVGPVIYTRPAQYVRDLVAELRAMRGDAARTPAMVRDLCDVTEALMRETGRW